MAKSNRRPRAHLRVAPCRPFVVTNTSPPRRRQGRQLLGRRGPGHPADAGPGAGQPGGGGGGPGQVEPVPRLQDAGQRQAAGRVGAPSAAQGPDGPGRRRELGAV